MKQRLSLRLTAILVMVVLLLAVVIPAAAQNYGVIVHAYRVNLRTGPSIAYPSVAQLVRGQQVIILGYSDNWANVRVSDTLTGWVNARYVASSAPPPSNPVPVGPYNAIVNAVTLNVRGGPSTFYGVIGKLSSGTAVNLIGRTADNVWVVVDAPGGLQGWVNSSFVNASIVISNLPISGTIFSAPPPPPPPVVTNVQVGIVSAVALNVRVGPGSFYGEIGRLVSGESVNLIGRSADASWLQIQTGSGLVGWVSTQYITTSFPIGNLPVRG
jgi:N-acetylmuramoyl-L-alanine amidase